MGNITEVRKNVSTFIFDFHSRRRLSFRLPINQVLVLEAQCFNYSLECWLE
jgi:hypothetical protein